MPLSATTALPAGVRGPVLFLAFCRFVSAWRSLVIFRSWLSCCTLGDRPCRKRDLWSPHHLERDQSADDEQSTSAIGCDHNPISNVLVSAFFRVWVYGVSQWGRLPLRLNCRLWR